jgi:hypothetical protein
MITFSADNTIKGQAKVVLQKFVIFVQNGKEMGHINASFDFSSLPPELHGVGLNMIPKCYRIDLPSCSSPTLTKPTKPSIEIKRWWQFWL